MRLQTFLQLYKALVWPHLRICKRFLVSPNEETLNFSRECTTSRNQLGGRDQRTELSGESQATQAAQIKLLQDERQEETDLQDTDGEVRRDADNWLICKEL